MSRKTRRQLLHHASRVPGLYSLLAFVLARRVTVSGRSMLPTLELGDRVLFDRLAYERERPVVGDVVLVRHPDSGLRMVKRLAGVPGDEAGGRTLRRGEYWVLGDNSSESTDSREFGPITRRDLFGRAWVRYWPRDRWRAWNSAGIVKGDS